MQNYSIALTFIQILSTTKRVREFKPRLRFVSYPYRFSVIKITKALYFIYCIVHATFRRSNRFTNYSIGYFSRYGRLCTHSRSDHVSSAILLNFVEKSNNYKQKNYVRQVNGPFTWLYCCRLFFFGHFHGPLCRAFK